jgi:hypothetical protein
MDDDLMTKHAPDSGGDTAIEARAVAPAPMPETAVLAVAARSARAARAVGPREATFHPAYVRQVCMRLREEGRDVD